MEYIFLGASNNSVQKMETEHIIKAQSPAIYFIKVKLLPKYEISKAGLPCT